MYPSTPIIDESIVYPQEILDLLHEFKKHNKLSEPVNRFENMKILVEKFAKIYQIEIKEISYINNGDKHSFRSHWKPASKSLVMVGKLSIITLLHEFAHALNMVGGEPFAVKWSLTLFKKVYPKAFVSLMGSGHTLIQREG